MEKNNKEIRNILMTEFKNEERIFAMQSFFGREAVIEIIKYFNDSLIEDNKRLKLELDSWKKENFYNVEMASETIKDIQEDNKRLLEALKDLKNECDKQLLNIPASIIIYISQAEKAISKSENKL